MERKITALKIQKRNPNRVNVFLDGEFGFGVARIVAAWLQVGQCLSEEKIAALQQQDVQEVAYQRALDFLSYRPRSCAEVRKKLSSVGFQEAVVESVLARLQQNGLIKDSQFARLWVENQTTFRPRGRRALTFELRQKGVTEQNIQNALDEIEDEETLAYRAGESRLKRWANLDWNAFRVKVGSYLMRRGFSYETITPVVRRLWSEVHPSQNNLTNENEDGRQ